MSTTKTENEVKRNPAKDFEEIAEYLEIKYSARYNTIRMVPEIYKEGGACFTEIDDFTFNSLFVELKKQGFRVTEQKLRIALSSNLIAPVNPIKDYFEDLPVWDGEDYIAQLAGTMKVADEKGELGSNPFWLPFLTKFLVSVVATAISENPGQLALVLTGSQGKGKSTWLNSLCPKSLKKDFLSTGGMIPKITDKATIDLLTEKLIINLDDQLDAFGYKDFEQIKSIITSRKLTARKSYARNDSTRKRLASLVASTNNPSILVDSHNRRYLVFEALEIDLDALKEVNLDKVYGQAYSLFKQGLRYYLNTEEQEQLQALNARYRNAPIEEELVMKFLTPAEKDDIEAQKLTATEIKLGLELNSGAKNLYPNSLGKALKARGFIKVCVRDGPDQVPTYKWLVIPSWP